MATHDVLDKTLLNLVLVGRLQYVLLLKHAQWHYCSVTDQCILSMMASCHIQCLGELLCRQHCWPRRAHAFRICFVLVPIALACWAEDILANSCMNDAVNVLVKQLSNMML
jgi:hypothetical protein